MIHITSQRKNGRESDNIFRFTLQNFRRQWHDNAAAPHRIFEPTAAHIEINAVDLNWQFMMHLWHFWVQTTSRHTTL